MTYAEATGAMDMVIFDCTNPDWDTKDGNNWESLVILLEEIKTYITLEHVRKTV